MDRQRPELTPDEKVERELRVLDSKAEQAEPARAAPCFNAAGDLCREVGQNGRALRYYGQAIDEYLKAHLFNAARAVARKLIGLSPDAVRARCTLVWLSIGRGLLATSRRELTEYVRSAKKANQTELAVRHLRMMGDVVPDGDLRRFLATQLQALGDDLGARALMKEPAEDVQSRTVEDEDERWRRVLQGALMGPDELLGRTVLPPGT